MAKTVPIHKPIGKLFRATPIPAPNAVPKAIPFVFLSSFKNYILFLSRSKITFEKFP